MIERQGRGVRSEEEIKIIMDMERDWKKKNMNKTLARKYRIEGRSTHQVGKDMYA